MKTVALVLGLVSSVAAWSAEPPTAEARIDALHDALLNAMQCACPQAERVERLAPVVTELFDVKSIARISSGRAWRDFEEAERDALIDALRELVVATYADRFDAFSGQVFERTGLAESRTGPIVKTQIVRSSGEAVPIDYYFRGDKVFNVVADGVSDLSLRRADYSSILKEQGYPALLAHIQENVQELRAAP